MTRNPALVLGLTAALALPAAPAPAEAPAQPQCAPHEAIMKGLNERYGETRQAMALSANAMVVEIWANAETGTWTITMTSPGGPTCMAASGEAWESLEEALPPTGNPA